MGAIKALLALPWIDPTQLALDPSIPPEPHVARCNEMYSGSWERA